MSTETSILDLILRVRKAGGGDKEVAAAMKDVIKSVKDAEHANVGMVKSLKDVEAGFNMAQRAIGYIGQAFDETVGKAANWDDAMGDLAQLTGQSVEETSLMAATFELVGIKGETLTKVLKTLAKDGINLNMRELGSLAEKYQALQDPIEKNRFLFEHFGRSASDMAEIMGRSKQELDQLTAAARTSGKVIGEDMANAGENLNVQLAILNQRWEGLTITIGNAAIPVINDAIQGGTDLLKVWAIAPVVIGQATGAITQQEAAVKANAIAEGDLLAAFKSTSEIVGVVTRDTDRLTTSTATAGLAINSYSIEVVAAAQHNYDGIAAIEAKNIALANEATATAALKLGMSELTTQTIFQAASEGLSSEAKLQLAASMGLVSQEAVIASGKIEDLKVKYDTNRDGVIDLGEATGGYLADLQALQDKANSIPDRQVKIIEFAISGNITGGDVGQLLTSDVNGNRQVRRAAGGPFSAGDAVIMNESPFTRPEVIVANPQGGGYVLTKQDAQAAVSASSNTTNNYYLNVTSAASSLGISSDFALMKALGGV